VNIGFEQDMLDSFFMYVKGEKEKGQPVICSIFTEAPVRFATNHGLTPLTFAH
jgi:hypothetical protein